MDITDVVIEPDDDAPFNETERAWVKQRYNEGDPFIVFALGIGAARLDITVEELLERL